MLEQGNYLRSDLNRVFLKFVLCHICRMVNMSSVDPTAYTNTGGKESIYNNNAANIYNNNAGNIYNNSDSKDNIYNNNNKTIYNTNA